MCIFVIYIEFFPYCLFVSNSQVIGCKDRLRNDLYCVGWGIKLYSIQSIKCCNLIIWNSSDRLRLQNCVIGQIRFWLSTDPHWLTSDMAYTAVVTAADLFVSIIVQLWMSYCTVQTDLYLLQLIHLFHSGKRWNICTCRMFCVERLCAVCVCQCGMFLWIMSYVGALFNGLTVVVICKQLSTSCNILDLMSVSVFLFNNSWSFTHEKCNFGGQSNGRLTLSVK